MYPQKSDASQNVENAIRDQADREFEKDEEQIEPEERTLMIEETETNATKDNRENNGYMIKPGQLRQPKEPRGDNKGTLRYEA